MTAPTRGESRFSPDRLAYWYFRLNGFLTTENFVVHPETGGHQRTDADLIAVRFGNRTEGGGHPLLDDPGVAKLDSQINVVIAEVKRGLCSLNGPWTRPDGRNMQEVLRCIGCLPPYEVAAASQAPIERGMWQSTAASVRMYAVGERRNALVIPDDQQLIWSHIIRFITSRFRDYRGRKSAVGQWSEDGRILQAAALIGDEDAIRAEFGLRPRAEIDAGLDGGHAVD